MLTSLAQWFSSRLLFGLGELSLDMNTGQRGFSRQLVATPPTKSRYNVAEPSVSL